MYNAPILKKAVEVIKLIVRENKPLGVTDIARSLTISKSTTFGILKSLEEEGFFVKDPSSKKYSTGSTLFELSKKILRTTDVAMTARPYLERLQEAVNETVFLGIREDENIKVLDVLEPQKEFKISSSVGARMSLVAGVAGKIFLSALSDREVVELLSQKGLRRYTENSIVDVEVFLEEIERTRAQGYAVDVEEYMKGIRAVGALIYSGHFVVAGLWVVGFTNSMSDDELPVVISHVKAAAEQISIRLSPFFPAKRPQSARNGISGLRDHPAGEFFGK
ncbi:MAG: IclR family transcriptional regulator [Syntrophorhabdales bacterium]|jgi:DNA-binding IclR family transcriptional regulator